MTTTTANTSAPHVHRVQTGHVTFGHLIRSEWIKLRSLRSTVWCLAIIFVVTIGMGLLMSITATSSSMAGHLPKGFGLQVAVFGTVFSQLVAAVLGALIITGEYSTGMIRSTLVAAPHRLPVLWAKAIVFGATLFVVGFVGMLLTVAVTTPILTSHHAAVDLGNSESWRMLAGAAVYLVIIGLLALGLGTIIRNSAGAIAAILGLLLIVPTVLSMIPVDWTRETTKYLPSSAGTAMYMGGSPTGSGSLEPWQGLLVLIAWVAVFFVVAALMLKKRDA